MNLDITFEESPWELTLQSLQPGTALSAARFLTLMEGETESVMEEALMALEEKHIELDVSDLPKPAGTSEAAVRLRREEQLVKSGKLMESLEETDPLRLYLEELAATPAFGDPALLAERLLAGDRTVVEQLTNLMLSRVVDHACALVGRGVLLQDLIQEGSLGLWQGILSYAGGDIEEHCDWHIRSGMARAVTVQAGNSGVGQKLRQALEDYRQVDERLLTELGRNPTLEEIAAELHMPPEEAATVAKTLEEARMLAQAKKPVETEPTPEDEQAVEDTAYFQMRQRIEELLADLEEGEAKLLTLRFGLEGGKPMTPEETGKVLGLTPEEVVAKEAAALAKLRNNG